MRDRVFLGLVHHPAMDREGREVATAVTTLDLHDLARLARTYGLGGVYVTTPLAPQRELVGRLLEHWTRGHGGEVNPCRREALLGIRIAPDLETAVQELSDQFGAKPLLVATSARPAPDRVEVGTARENLTAESRPVLLLFGTGWGLAPRALDVCDQVLAPVQPPTGYNHLSVRSAASIIVDRLFGEW